MNLRRLSALKANYGNFSLINVIRRCHSDGRQIKIGNVNFEKSVSSKNPEYVPKKFSKFLFLL